MFTYTLSQSIPAMYVHAKPYGSSGGALKVYIPSLMPKISMGNPKVTPVSLNKSCFCNASDCKPAVASKISTQNYVTAKTPFHAYEFPCYWYGTGLRVHAEATDCLTCRLYSEDEDKSTLWP